MKKNERIRVNMRLPADLVIWARKYGYKHDRTFTSIVETGLEILQDRALLNASKKKPNAR